MVYLGNIRVADNGLSDLCHSSIPGTEQVVGHRPEEVNLYHCRHHEQQQSSRHSYRVTSAARGGVKEEKKIIQDEMELST